jgi:multidrug efflux pump subunit AcrB
LRFIDQQAGEGNIAMSLGYVGVVPPTFPINAVYHWSGGPEEVVVRVALRKDSGIRTEAFKRDLREKLAEHLKTWLAAKWRSEGVPAERANRRAQELRLSFEPADIINEVMSFGSPTPVEVAVSGPKLNDNREFAEKVRQQMALNPSLRDLQISQTLDYPTVQVNINREKAKELGVTAEDVARSMLAATSSSRFVVPNYWRDPGSGIGYQVQVEIPQARMNSPEEVGAIPVKKTATGNVLLRDVAEIKPDTMPGEFDRYQMQRVISMTANIDGEDLGRTTSKIERAISAAGKPPAGVKVDIRGQAVPLRELTRSLLIGLAFAVAAIFLLLWAYFQSIRLAMTAVSAVPAVIAGVALTLWLTRTSLNLQSFMGSIMAIGVAVANAILLVTFAERHRSQGKSPIDAAVEGARGRVRPILMTGGAMIAGMLPMALAFGEGGEQTAPLGRAVIGGLSASIMATLLVLPAVFALFMGWAGRKSPSLDPTDRDSAHFVPVAAQELPAPDSRSENSLQEIST